MDMQTPVETFKIKSTQKPFYNVIEPSINHYKPFPTPTNNIDLSFSAYLNNENSSKHPTLDDPEINVFDAQKYFSETNDSKEIKPEISSSNINPGHSASRNSSVDRYGRNFRVRSFHNSTPTPTASSEASWNSQTGLLSKPQGGVSVSLRNVAVIDHHHHHSKKISGGTKWFFCRKCPCAGKKSLQVIGELENSTNRTSSLMGSEANFHQSKKEGHKSNERMVQLQKLSNISLKKSASPVADDEFPERHKKFGFNSARILSENNFILSNDVLLKRVRASTSTPTAFTFPVLKHSSTYKNPKKKEVNIVKTSSFEDPARESLEVFQPPQVSISRKTMEDDVASDASSDLFEIESFTTQTASYRKRDSLDEASTLNSAGKFSATDNFNGDHEPITPRTECYAPSEVSIDWSVTTAEGFDKSSVTNFSTDYYEDSTISRLRSMEKYGVQAASSGSLHWNEGGGKKKAAGNGLLGCRHENAVNVGPNPVKFVKESPPILPLISTSGHVASGASRPPKPNLQQSSSRTHARLSLAFAA